MLLNIYELIGEEIYLHLERATDEIPDKGYVPAYYFTIHRNSDGIKVGHCDLRIGHNENTKFGGNIGYTVDELYRGNHYAGKACLLLFELARRHGMEYVNITCDPHNVASQRTCQYSGAKYIEQLDIPSWHEMYKEGKRHAYLYEITL